MKKTYFIKKKIFEKLYEYSEEVYGNISLIKMFCERNQDTDEFYKIIPILKTTYRLSDELYAYFINTKK